MKRFLLLIGLLIFIALHAAPGAYAAKDIRAESILPEGIVKEGAGKGILPTAEFKEDVVPQSIKIVLMLAGSVSIAVFIYAGIMLLIAQGNEEELKKFKDILVWSIIGLAFITLSYALIRGIMQIVFK